MRTVALMLSAYIAAPPVAADVVYQQADVIELDPRPYEAGHSTLTPHSSM
jgi:hypothetical protein